MSSPSDDSPTSPIDQLVAAQQARRRGSLGALPGSVSGQNDSRQSCQLDRVPEDAETAPDAYPERANTMDAYNVTLSPKSVRCSRVSMESTMSGVPVCELFMLTNDPLLQKQVRKADSNNDGRISRRDILQAFQNEASAKQKLKWGLIIGGALLLFCLLMLAANAALTYVVISMSRETSVQSTGVLTDKTGTTVIGTAQTAEVTDLLYAYHTPADQAAALMSLRELVVTSASGTVAVYQVLSVSLVPGQRLECVVAAPTALAEDAAGNPTGSLPAAELIRIVISADGVHEVRSGAGAGTGAGRRRLLQAGRPQLGESRTESGSVQGVMTGTTTTSCGDGSGTCSADSNQMSCPAVATCGADGQLYDGPCEARQAGTSVLCTNCNNPNCPPPTVVESPDFVQNPTPDPAVVPAEGGVGQPDGDGQSGDGGQTDGGPSPSPPPPAGDGQTGGDSTGGQGGVTESPPPPPPKKRPVLVVDGQDWVRKSPPPTPRPPMPSPPTAVETEAATAKRRPPPPPPRPRPKPSPKPKPRPPPPRPKPRPSPKPTKKPPPPAKKKKASG